MADSDLAGQLTAVSAVAGGVVGWITSLVRARSGAGKARAEGAAIVVNSAADLVDRLNLRNDKLSDRLDELEARQRERDERDRERDERERERELEQHRLFRAHTRWDDTIRTRLSAALGEPVEPPPPLFVE